MEYIDVGAKLIFTFPKIESPIGLDILPIDIKTSTWMKGVNFDEITTSIPRPVWADIQSQSHNNLVQFLIVGFRNFEKKNEKSELYQLPKAKDYNGFYKVNFQIRDELDNIVEEEIKFKLIVNAVYQTVITNFEQI